MGSLLQSWLHAHGKLQSTLFIFPTASFLSMVLPRRCPIWFLSHAINQPLRCSRCGWWEKWPIWSTCPFQSVAVVRRIYPTWQISSSWIKHIFWLKIKGKKKKGGLIGWFVGVFFLHLTSCPVLCIMKSCWGRLSSLLLISVDTSVGNDLSDPLQVGWLFLVYPIP